MSDNIIPFNIPLNKVTIGDSLVNEIYCNNKLVYLQEGVLKYTYELINLQFYDSPYHGLPVSVPLPSREQAIKDLNNQFIVFKYSDTVYLRAENTNPPKFYDYFLASIMPKITAYNLDTLTLRLGNTARSYEYVVPEIGAILDIKNVNHLIIEADYVYEDVYLDYFTNLDIIALEVNTIEIRFRKFHEPTAPTHLSLLKYSDYRKDLFKDADLCHWNNDYIDMIFPENNNITSVEGMFSNACNLSWECVDEINYRFHLDNPDYPTYPPSTPIEAYIFDIVIDTQYTNNITNYNNFFYNYNKRAYDRQRDSNWTYDKLSLLNWRIAEGATFNGFLEGANFDTITISGWHAEDGANFEGFLMNAGLPNRQSWSPIKIYVRNCNFGSPSSVTHMFDFKNKNNINIYIENCTFDIKSNTKDTSCMFYCFSSLTELDLFNLDLFNWDVSGVEDMSGMFAGCSSLTELDLSGWDTGSVTNMGGVFAGCSSLTKLDVSSWDTGSVTNMGSVTNTIGMFEGCISLTELDVSSWDTSNVSYAGCMFKGCISLTELDLSGWDTSNVSYARLMFASCRSLTELDLSGWDVSNVTDTSYMFEDCSSLTKLDLSGWDTSNLNYASYMFEGCSSLTELDLSGWDTSNVSYAGCMFEGCSSLTELDLSGWDTSNFSTTSYMFADCSSLTELDLSGWDTSNLNYAIEMFYGCSSLTKLDLSSWDTSNLNYSRMSDMFYGCSSLIELDLTSWDTSKFTSKTKLFSGVPSYCNIKVGPKWTLTEKETAFSGTFNRVG